MLYKSYTSLKKDAVDRQCTDLIYPSDVPCLQFLLIIVETYMLSSYKRKNKRQFNDKNNNLCSYFFYLSVV